MTNHWADMQHCKTILVEGSNVAENHPMAFKWIRKAQDAGAVLIHVDPRFTRTSAGADIYARIRPGADPAFLNTVINYILEHRLYDEEYLKDHTNALMLGDADFASRTACSVDTTRRSTPTTRRRGAMTSGRTASRAWPRAWTIPAASLPG
jgi:anaerobic selenocysteine-containing dehydrogenase